MNVSLKNTSAYINRKTYDKPKQQCNDFPVGGRSVYLSPLTWGAKRGPLCYLDSQPAAMRAHYADIYGTEDYQEKAGFPRHRFFTCAPLFECTRHYLADNYPQNYMSSGVY